MIEGNFYLNMNQMKTNAREIAIELLSRGWSLNAICGMLGNMQTESTINPQLWQSLASGMTNLGYGLVQWTPASKLISWAQSEGKNYTNWLTQMDRLDWEVANNVQWISSEMTFAQFKVSTASPYDLGLLFLRAYERPKNPNQPIRGTQAQFWFNELSDIEGTQRAIFPLDVMNITQGENGQFSHQGTLCIDFVGTYNEYPYYAPCDIECIYVNISEAIVVWKSTSPVLCADGQIRNIVFDCIHQNTIWQNVGMTRQQGELMGTTGVGGFATGDHLHLNVIEGSTFNGFVQKPGYALGGTELHIYDVFFVNENTQILSDYNYPWNYTGDIPDPPDPPRPEYKIMMERLLKWRLGNTIRL